jgi:UDP-N-acetylglucosamine 3-dehydrogenase
MDSNLKIGIVGFGGAGMAQYRHFQSIKGCKVAAVCDPQDAGLDRARERDTSLFLTDDFDKFIGLDIDAVAICSPDRTHAEYMVKSLQAGKHTLCEKPLTDSIDGCKSILEAERKSPGCVAAVQHQMRHLPSHLKMKKIMTSGELGKVSYIEGYYVHNLTKRAALFDNWRFLDNATPLVYSGCHFVDLLRWLLDDEVHEVMGMANNMAFPEYPESDFNVILLRFKSGIIGKVVTAFGAGRPQDHSVRVYGSEKSIENNLLFSKDGSFSVFHRPFLQIRSEDEETLKDKLRRIRGFLKPVIFGKFIERFMKTGLPIEYAISNYPMRLYEHTFAVRESVLDFVRSIRTRKVTKCSVMDAAKTVATCLAGVEAYRTGKAVAVADYWLDEFKE